jgi:hypothetical protein
MASQIAALNNAPQDTTYPYGVFAVGDKAHVFGYSDIYPATVVKVERNGKKVTVQIDKYKKADGQVVEMVEGGFVAHCTNQNEIKYDISRDENGTMKTFTLRKWRGRFCWTVEGDSANGHQKIGMGWRAFYDYNF